MQDGTAPTSMLAHWARDRVHGAQIPIEIGVMKQARDTAHLYNLFDRGTLEVGKKADLNMVNMETIHIHRPVSDTERHNHLT
jgi:N-acyl-D-amino-acid deacylase